MTDPTPEDVESVKDKAFDLARLICPLPEEIDVGDAIERMPDDLLAAATCLGDLCRAIDKRDALIRELRDALAACVVCLAEMDNGDRNFQGMSNAEVGSLWLSTLGQTRAALRKANEALGEKA